MCFRMDTIKVVGEFVREKSPFSRSPNTPSDALSDLARARHAVNRIIIAFGVLGVCCANLETSFSFEGEKAMLQLSGYFLGHLADCAF
ncbi:hypothetical protein EVAR_14175_1 [Eumeta japonica]|uniref:Uncharacterized protein n=1 Tax=Eumeta variegata TaxID=151549 RepID=A0A4C1UFU1_EUMVA|nr:hypothetical protein EVAR_14175_1 [Eumeta japonica]